MALSHLTRETQRDGGTKKTQSESRFAYSWRALRHRNYRLFFFGQGISVIGNWMTRVATGWLVYRLTGSPAMLGLVGFAGQAPTFFLAAFAGVWIERLDRRKLMIATQILACLQSLALAALTLRQVITLSEIVTLSIVQGLITAFDTPTRQAFLVQMVDGKKDLGNAIALSSSLVTVARLIGPALAGLVIGAVGEGWCFFIDGASYLAVISSLLSMRIASSIMPRRKISRVAQLREGWSYVSDFAPIRTVLLLFALISLMGMPFSILLPIFAAQVLHGGPHTLGFLSGAAGVGALASSVIMALRKDSDGLPKAIQRASMIFGVGLILFGFSHRLWLSILLLALAGYGMMQQMASSNTLVQTLTPDDKRSRVMSYYTVAFVGVTPFGSLLAGTLASYIGAPNTVIVTGTCCVAGSLWFTSQLPKVHRAMKAATKLEGLNF